MERITGVFSVAPFGRRMSACSFTPSEDGIVAWVQVAPAGTSAALAAAGQSAAARAASSRAGRSLMRPATNRTQLSCGVGHARRMRLVRQLAAVVLLPGTVAVLVPALLLGDAELAPWPLALVGGAVLAFGLCVIAWTVALFAGVGRGTLAPWDPPERLVIRGPYRYVRNPMITGVVAVLLGQAAPVGSLRVLRLAGVVFALHRVHFPLLQEPGPQACF